MKIALLCTDTREHDRKYQLPIPAFGTAPEALLRGFEHLTDIEVHLISCLKQPATTPVRLAPNILYHGLVVPQIGWRRSGYQGCIRAVRKQLANIQPHIVHGQGTERDCGISAALSGFPNVVTIHGIMTEMARIQNAPPFSSPWVAAKLETFTLKRTNGVLCNSTFTEAAVRERTRKTWLVPNALREEFFSTPARQEKPSIPILLNVGVVCDNKRQLDLLQVAEHLHQRGLRFVFKFVGTASPDDPYATEFLRRIKHAETRGYATHNPYADVEELIQIMDQSVALIHFPKVESFGLVVAEALTRNLKVFAANVGGIPNIANNVTDAELIDAGDFTTLEKRLAEWLDANCPRATIRGSPSERFHPRAIAERHIEIYREVLSART